MNNLNKSLIEEGVRLLNTSDSPDLYHRLRRWARIHVKHEPVAPVDRINWPKGILMTGLLHKAMKLRNADNSVDRASSIYAMASVQDYLDRWIYDGAPVHYVDDALAGQALLALAEINGNEDGVMRDKYLRAAGVIMKFLMSQRTDPEGVIPYRPDHGDDLVFADSSGMVVPFAIWHGVACGDDDSMDLGLNQIRCVMKYGLDDVTGLPFHAYSLTGSSDAAADAAEVDPAMRHDHPGLRQHASGWGRALGWIMYGLGMSAEVLDRYGAISPLEIRAQNEIHEALSKLTETALCYVREDGLYGSMLTDPDSRPDTSATAMIYFGQTIYDGGADASALMPYVTSNGAVNGAQGECQGLGLYSDQYGSYPWSEGSRLML